MASSATPTRTRAACAVRQAWLYATILTVGYMVSRGLAKAGSRQPYDEDHASPAVPAPPAKRPAAHPLSSSNVSPGANS